MYHLLKTTSFRGEKACRIFSSPITLRIYLMMLKQITFLLTLLADRANWNFEFFATARKHCSSSILEWFKESWTCARPSAIEWCVNYFSSIILRPWYPCWTDLAGEVEDEIWLNKMAFLPIFWPILSDSQTCLGATLGIPVESAGQDKVLWAVW